MFMELDHTPESLTQITLDLLRKEEYRCDIYIRPLAYKADEIIGVKLHDLQDEITIAAVPFESYLANDTNAHVTVSSWRRNVFMVRNGTLITPPITENILEGITRRTVMELASKELQVKVIERPIDRTEIYMSEELFMTGTAAQIIAVTQVDHRLIGAGKMGPIASRLRELYLQAVHGQLNCSRDRPHSRSQFRK
jgi:branched-chain amino acid aminotransferase